MAWFTEFRVDGESDEHMICFHLTLNYRLADGSLLHVEQEAAWCERCACFGSAELVPSVEDLRNRIRDLQTPNNKVRSFFRTEAAIGRAIAELETRLKWRGDRRSPARCLRCGSTEIVPVRFGDHFSVCFVSGKRVVQLRTGFADTAFWIAEFTPEGIARSTGPGK